MTELKVTKEKVLIAAEKCPSAKEVLKELFPEVFVKKFKQWDLILREEGNCRLENLYIYNNGKFCSPERRNFVYEKDFDKVFTENYKIIGNLDDDSSIEYIKTYIKTIILQSSVTLMTIV